MNLEELQRIRGKLKATETVVTSPTGEVTIEDRHENDEKIVSNRRKKKVEYLKRCGFVVDLEPDLKVGKAMENVYFGSQDVAADLEILQKFGITHILNVGTGIPNHFPEKFSYLKIDILDLPETRILNHFPEIFNWIDNLTSVPDCENNVFIHCNAGISRSATITIGYLMKSLKIDLKTALEICKAQRPNVKPNAGFMKQLEEFDTFQK
ncbi:unnamed protein product [Caenorhabditis angaria]|uniref:Protein-serine/threonine phosphatase n=1 Tax=Caenorhabditis angaria TaxID=860376 RepID=A0A9P1IIL7_9PELO|nr:unnamed protein product [Caenorhabditis angaria]